MVKWKTKSSKKLSIRERQRRGIIARLGENAGTIGKLPKGRAFDFAIDRFIRDGSCRHGRSLGSPCSDFDDNANGACKLGGGTCDLLIEKGERYMREYE